MTLRSSYSYLQLLAQILQLVQVLMGGGHSSYLGWSGGAMALGKLPDTDWNTVSKGSLIQNNQPTTTPANLITY